MEAGNKESAERWVRAGSIAETGQLAGGEAVR